MNKEELTKKIKHVFVNVAPNSSEIYLTQDYSIFTCISNAKNHARELKGSEDDERFKENDKYLNGVVSLTREDFQRVIDNLYK